MQVQSLDLGVRRSRALISSDKVEGTPVYSSDGESLGTIDRLMIDKLSGKVAYAVMTTRGGAGQYPIPWSLLTFNTKLNGYEVNISVVQMQGAPKLQDDESSTDTREEEDQLYRYYNTPPYWA